MQAYNHIIPLLLLKNFTKSTNCSHGKIRYVLSNHLWALCILSVDEVPYECAAQVTIELSCT